MPQAASFRFGKTTVSLEVTGCFYCGGRWSSGWSIVAVHAVTIAKQRRSIALQACADCSRRLGSAPGGSGD